MSTLNHTKPTSFKLREVVAFAVGVLCLVTAAAVSAQSADGWNAQLGEIKRKQTQAKAYVSTMEGWRAKALDAFESAKKSSAPNAAAVIQCTKDVYSTVKQMARLGNTSLEGMEEAYATKNVTSFGSAYEKVSVAYGKADEAYGQLAGCGGDGSGAGLAGVNAGAGSGGADVQKQISDSQPSVNPTEGSGTISTGSQQAVSASPFLQVGADEDES